MSDVDCADSSLISAMELWRGRTAVGGFLKFCELSPCDFDLVTRLWEEGYPGEKRAGLSLALAWQI